MREATQFPQSKRFSESSLRHGMSTSLSLENSFVSCLPAVIFQSVSSFRKTQRQASRCAVLIAMQGVWAFRLLSMIKCFVWSEVNFFAPLPRCFILFRHHAAH